MWWSSLFDGEDSADSEWSDSTMARVLLLLTGALMVRLGFRVWVTTEPRLLVDVAAVQVIMLVAVWCVLTAVTESDLETWGPRLAGGVIVAVTLAVLTVMPRAWVALATDALLFSKYATVLTLDGANVYTTSMEGATELPGESIRWMTTQIDGSYVWSFSYPAGAFVAYLPAAALGIKIRTVSVLAAGLAGLLLVHDSPPLLATAVPLAMLLPRNLIVTAAGGLTDMIWVLPVLVAMRYWARERWTIAAVAMGVACSIKQQPWIITPFLAVWLWRASPERRTFAGRAGRCLAAGVGTFTLINLPWIIADPGAWVAGFLTPVGSTAPLVKQGVGLAVLTSSGVYGLPGWWHTTAVGVVLGVSLLTYAVYWERVRWVAWVVPMLVLFVHSRSLMSYFTHFVPVGYYAVLTAQGELETAAPTLTLDRARAALAKVSLR